MGRRAKPAKGQADAKQPRARTSPKDGGAKVRDLEKRLAEALKRESEALEQQTATAEILRVISSSPTGVQPVFEAIARSATTLCEADLSGLYPFDGDLIHFGAQHGRTTEEIDAARRAFPQPPSRLSVVARSILAAAIVQVADVGEDPEVADALRMFKTVLSVPMLREGRPLGAIMVARRAVRPFSDKQIALLKTFADQAVIAIENVRLFTELQASNRDLTTALDTQTATSDILRVISRSQTNVQPVFDAILGSAVRLLRGYSGVVTRMAGDQIELAALTSTDDAGDAATRAAFPQAHESDGPHAQAMRDRTSINITDAQTDPRASEAVRANARARGNRSWIIVPLLRHDEAVGTIAVTRRESGGFTDDEIALLEAFADQAVIAIENVRLFTELQQKNEALTQAHAQVTEALDQQTATGEILQVISSSPTDTRPVFEAIIESAARLCSVDDGWIVLAEGDALRAVAARGQLLAQMPVHNTRRVLVSRETTIGRAILDRATLHVADLGGVAEIEYPEARALQRVFGHRSQLVTPLLREGAAIGAILLARFEVRPFSERQVELLKTFADQAVIAIENVRLFAELQTRTQELTRSVEQLTALGDVARVVSSSLDLDTVLTSIVGRAVHLSGTDGGTIFEYDEGAEEFSPRATLNADASQSALLRATRLRRGEGAVGQMAVTREPFQIPDIAAEGAYESRLRGALLEAGTRAVLAIPLLHEERIVGGLVVTRRTPGAFTPEIVEILRTFATQSALAIQNARLFREIERKSRELEVASQHKSEFLANMSHELRTPLNAIIGYSELLEEEAEDLDGGRLVPDLQRIATAAKHQLSLINDILDLSKIEAGRMELELADFHLPSAVENALILVRERASRRGIALGHTIDSGLGMVRADERKVKQVLLNLLSNALKFTPEGGRIDVRAGVRDDLAEIAVADTGVGIASEDQEAVFEEFRQVGTAAKKVEGTGLGLALSRKFVELHGGRIWVRSQVGEGSTFTFTLPVRPEKEMGA